jgi:hypothetical protein
MGRYITSKTKVKPCPCCGNSDLDVGIQGSLLFGVRCMTMDKEGNLGGCRLRIVREIPDEYPEELWNDNRTPKQNLRELERWTLEKAIRAWNRRVND